VKNSVKATKNPGKTAKTIRQISENHPANQRKTKKQKPPSPPPGML
jgi:hypothetical protein